MRVRGNDWPPHTQVMRLRPPVHMIPTRMAACDTSLGGYAIPKSTVRPRSGPIRGLGV
jgi:hypothetical protein